MNDVKKLFFFVFIGTVLKHSSPTQKPITLPVEDRIKLLKYEIKEQIRSGRNRHHKHKHHYQHKKPNENERNVMLLENEQYDYVDMDALPITPIMDYDERKKDEKFKLRQLKTTTTTEPILPPATTEYHEPKAPMRSVQLKTLVEKPVDSFYRRYVEKDVANIQAEWVHCQELIKPFIVGVKTDIQPPIETEERTYSRFMQLIAENITTYSKDDVISHLYQISNVNIRLFQWDVSKIRTLLNVLSGGQRHTFKSIIYGVRELIKKWHLDYSNTTNLLKQSRIFRPPCVLSDDYGGSTMSSSAIRYSKPTRPTTTCVKKDDRDDEDTRK